MASVPLSYSRQEKQPVTGDPSFNATTATLTGYPVLVSDLYRSTTDSAATATPEPDHNGSHESLESWFRVIGFILFLFVPILPTFIGQILIPRLPGVALVSSSIAVHNMSNNYMIGDLDLGFSIENKDSNGMMYKDFSLLAFSDGDRNHDRDHDSFSTAIAPFGQDGYDQSTVWFSLQNITAPVSDVISSEATILVRLELRARVRYKGTTWMRREISIKAYCGTAKIQFPLSKFIAQKLHSGNCSVDGLWSNAPIWVWFGFIFGVPVLLTSLSIIAKFWFPILRPFSFYILW